MKKVGFMLPALRFGGAEKVFLNLLKKISSDYEIYLILNEIEGEYLSHIPDNVTIIHDKLWTFKDVVKFDLKKIKPLSLFKDFIHYIKFRINKNNEKNYHYLVSRTPKLTIDLDCLVCFVANVSTQIFRAVDGYNCNNKIAWIHGETNSLKNDKYFQQFFLEFNQIFCVSKVTLEHFISKYPLCKDKCKVFYNLIDTDSIISLSKETIPPIKEHKRDFVIVSVGRLSPEKGFEMIPDILTILKNHNIKWILIGDGPQKDLIIEKAKKNGVSESLILSGFLSNPYPYIAACDCYVQPSLEEGFSSTICEAAILGKAIIGTKTSGGIYEQLTNMETGLITDPNPRSIADKILLLINSPEIKKMLEARVKTTIFSNDSETKKLKEAIDNL